jgi:hypothetical protein
MVTAIMETALNKKIRVYTFPEFWSAPRIAFLFQGFQLRLDNAVMPENDPVEKCRLAVPQHKPETMPA